MAITQTGFVCYTDDGLYFRRVELRPPDTDSELDNPVWVTMGCDPARTARLDKFDLAAPASWPVMDGEA